MAAPEDEPDGERRPPARHVADESDREGHDAYSHPQLPAAAAGHYQGSREAAGNLCEEQRTDELPERHVGDEPGPLTESEERRYEQRRELRGVEDRTPRRIPAVFVPLARAHSCDRAGARPLH